MRSRCLFHAVATAAALGPVVADGQDERGMPDMRTGEQYAALAAHARSLEDARAKLQQALNCLEGPQGAEYRRSAGDPCGGAGLAHELPEGSVNRIKGREGNPARRRRRDFPRFRSGSFTALAVRAVLVEGTK